MKPLKKRTAMEWEGAIRSLPEQFRPKMLYIVLFDYSGYTCFSDSDYLQSLKLDYQCDMTGDYELVPTVVERALLTLGYTKKQARDRAYESPTFKRDIAPRLGKSEVRGVGVRGSKHKVGKKVRNKTLDDYGELV